MKKVLTIKIKNDILVLFLKKGVLSWAKLIFKIKNETPGYV